MSSVTRSRRPVLIESITLALFLIPLVACRERAAPVHVDESSIPLSLVKQREEFDSFGFISDVQGLVQVGDRIYFSDFDNNRVMVVNLDLDPLGQIGRPGQGPGELRWAGPLCFSQERLLVNNNGQHTLELFDKEGNFLDAFPVQNCNFSTRFTAFDEMVYLSTPGLEQTITAVGFDGKPLFHFGKPLFPENPKIKAVRNLNQLAIAETAQMPVLLAVNNSEPVIDMYTLDGRLLLHKDLQHLPFLANRQEEMERMRKDNPTLQYSTIVLFSDIYVCNQELYLRQSSLHPPYAILQFHVTADQIQFVRRFVINEQRAHFTFCVTPDQTFYLFDAATDSIQIYRPTATVPSPDL